MDWFPDECVHQIGKSKEMFAVVLKVTYIKIRLFTFKIN